MSRKWSDEELEASVKAYLEMYKKFITNKEYKKSEYYKELSEKFGRTQKAFEYRMQNISHVLSTQGKEWLKGLAPKKNVGANIQKKIEEILYKITNN